MIRRFLVLALLVGGVLSAASAPVLAQDGRLADELELTERRIELAESIVGASSDVAAQAELAAAVDFQRRARGAAGAGQPVVALRLTRDSRSHADRAIAIVRGLPDPDRAITQVERTRELIDRSRDQVESCADARARNLIRVSVEMQLRAETAIHDSRYLAGLQLTMSAREKLFQALRRCRMEESVPDGAARALARSDEVIARARAAVDAHPDEGARQALARAESVQAEAQREYRASHFEASLRLTQAARALGHRASRLAGARPK